MSKNYNDFEAMYDRAIEIATLIAEIWGKHYSEDLTAIRHYGIEINASGMDHCGNHVELDFPSRYLGMSNENIIAEQSRLADKEKARKEDVNRKKEAKEKEKRRGLYVALNKEFRNEMCPKDDE